MPSLALKVYSVFFKLLLKHKLQTLLQQSAAGGTEASFGVASRPDESAAPSNPSFGPDGVATKDIHVDLLSSLSLRLFLPDSSLAPRNGHAPHHQENGAAYGGYLPPVAPPDARRRSHAGSPRKLPVILQFHGGAFVGGSNTSTANDFFCRRIAKLLDVIVIAVGYRLAPENRYPAAFEDGFKVLNWLGKQANLAECSKSMESTKAGGVGDASRSQIVDSLGASSVEPWLAAHGDPSRCVLLGVSCGANIADFVARKAVEAGKLIDPVKVVAQVLILDHPAANPLVPGRGPPLKCMPPTLTVVAEHDWMRDRAIAYSEELRKVNVDAPVLEYKDAVHEFATLDMLLKTPQAQACADDIAIWVKKYISIRGHEFSY
ncbi:hypothetical protein OPV22_012486 [Ensete ventricosum]|uniref:Alpha/beta hydrolase fold-3 domain-containing protein n=1 Tax=Ensete ventricosum TaxID=4639 RepID=A0AAV8R695_ENSVE|nr:hypothetical protein OPV22_012486 [Ensete ventricosum]